MTCSKKSFGKINVVNNFYSLVKQDSFGANFRLVGSCRCFSANNCIVGTCMYGCFCAASLYTCLVNRSLLCLTRISLTSVFFWSGGTDYYAVSPHCRLLFAKYVCGICSPVMAGRLLFVAFCIAALWLI